MISLAIAFVLSFANVNTAQISNCETYAPTLAGISVTVCSGEVVSKCDASGNCLGSAEQY